MFKVGEANLQYSVGYVYLHFSLGYFRLTVGLSRCKTHCKWRKINHSIPPSSARESEMPQGNQSFSNHTVQNGLPKLPLTIAAMISIIYNCFWSPNNVSVKWKRCGFFLLLFFPLTDWIICKDNTLWLLLKELSFEN